MTWSYSCPISKWVLPSTRGSVYKNLPPWRVGPALVPIFIFPSDLDTAAHHESIFPHPPILQMGESRSKRKVAHPSLVKELGMELIPRLVVFQGSWTRFPWVPWTPAQLGPLLVFLILVSGTKTPPEAQARSHSGHLPLQSLFVPFPPHCTDQEAPVQRWIEMVRVHSLAFFLTLNISMFYH